MTLNRKPAWNDPFVATQGARPLSQSPATLSQNRSSLYRGNLVFSFGDTIAQLRRRRRRRRAEVSKVMSLLHKLLLDAVIDADMEPYSLPHA